MGNIKTLKAKQEKAILALMTNRGVEEAARAVHIAPRTLFRWLNEPAFVKAYHKARRSAFSQSTARLQQASNAAVSSVLKIMLDQHTPPSARLRAVDLVMTHSARALEREDLEARVAELERLAEAEQASPNQGVTE